MWYVATSATVANGSTVVAINNGDDISNIQEKSALIFEDGSPVEVVRAYLDGGGNKFIQLARPWASTSRSNSPLVVFPTDADFAAATAELRRVIDTLQIASTTDMQSATNDAKISTPLKVKQAIDFHAYNKSAADAEFVSRSDIVGTVSQSGGVPTGAIIESGSNANGDYVKFADGTVVITNPRAKNYSSPPAGEYTHSFNFPLQLIDSSYVVLPLLTATSAVNSGRINSIGAQREADRSASSVDIYISTTNTVNGLVDLSVVVFGRWY